MRTPCGIDLQATEKALSVIEGYFAQAIDALLGEGDPKGVHPDLRKILGVQVAIQWTRTRRYRDCIVELSQKLMQAQADELVRRNFPNVPKDHYPKVTLAEHSIGSIPKKWCDWRVFRVRSELRFV